MSPFKYTKFTSFDLMSPLKCTIFTSFERVFAATSKSIRGMYALTSLHCQGFSEVTKSIQNESMLYFPF